MSKFQDLCDDYGVTQEEFLEQYCFDSIVPAICMNDGCNATYEYEPDCTKGWCDECQTKSVQSGLIILGII